MDRDLTTLQYPRWVHKANASGVWTADTGRTKYVTDPRICREALEDGWVIDPNELASVRGTGKIIVVEGHPMRVDDIPLIDGGAGTIPDAVVEPILDTTDDAVFPDATVSPDGPAKRKPGRPSKAQRG